MQTSILETDRVTQDELVELCCRKTYQVKSKSIYTGENDALYSIYAIHADQNPQFMRTWLKLYADMYKRQFMTVGEEYLNRKNLRLIFGEKVSRMDVKEMFWCS